MSTQDYRNLLEQSNDKLSIFADVENIHKCKPKLTDFLDLISEFLSDEEKLELFNYKHFMEFPKQIKYNILKSVSNETVLLQMLTNDIIMGDFEYNDVSYIISQMSNNIKKQIIYNEDFIIKHNLSNYTLRNVISSLSNADKSQILNDTNLVNNVLHLTVENIIDLSQDLTDDNLKIGIIELHQLDYHQKLDLLKTCSNDYKQKVVLYDEDLDIYDKISLLGSLDIDALSDFLSRNYDFCNICHISPHSIVKRLTNEKKIEFVQSLSNCNIPLNEKRKILATLSESVKKSIDTTNFPKEYLSSLNVKATDFGDIIFDLDQNPENYRDLDSLICINPENFSENERSKFMEFCKVCPSSKIINTFDGKISFSSVASEYIEGEKWISSLIDSLKPEYSDAQKIALIDNAIGKKISYSPDFDTEVSDKNDCRALWRIISSGYGVCNGIANLENYIFSRIGIDSERIDSGQHSFLKINNIELPLANGELVKGNTILDPTWNLTAHRFGAMPDCFCMNYENARKHDIDSNGKDHECHKNDDKLQDATLDLNEQNLRLLFKSVDLAGKDGFFPIKNLADMSKQLDNFYANQPEQNLKEQFLLLSKTCPEFVSCQNSSMGVLSSILLNNENLTFNKCVVNRVFKKDDVEKKPVLYVYINSDELGEKFYFADSNENAFVELSQDDFTKKFDCYEMDLETTNGIRPWENQSKRDSNIDLSKTSGKVIVGEVEER